MIDQVHPVHLQEWIASQTFNGLAVVLDVRETWEIETACIKVQGFELVKIPMHLITERLQELDEDRPIAVLCHHGARSFQVAAFLKHQGFSKVVNIAGGIHAWSSQVDKSVPTY